MIKSVCDATNVLLRLRIILVAAFFLDYLEVARAVVVPHGIGITY